MNNNNPFKYSNINNEMKIILEILSEFDAYYVYMYCVKNGPPSGLKILQKFL